MAHDSIGAFHEILNAIRIIGRIARNDVDMAIEAIGDGLCDNYLYETRSWLERDLERDAEDEGIAGVFEKILIATHNRTAIVEAERKDKWEKFRLACEADKA